MNNLLFVVLILSAPIVYASEGQVEGQPGAMAPGGLAISSSAAQPSFAAASSSSASAVMRYYDKGTQTDVSGQDSEQIKARISCLLNNPDDLYLPILEKKLSVLNEKIQEGSMLHVRVMQALHTMLENQGNEQLVKKYCDIHEVLEGQQLLEDYPRWPEYSKLDSNVHRILRQYFNKK